MTMICDIGLLLPLGALQRLSRPSPYSHRFWTTFAPHISLDQPHGAVEELEHAYLHALRAPKWESGRFWVRTLCRSGAQDSVNLMVQTAHRGSRWNVASPPSLPLT